ncbi:hypothetical protein FHW36_11840 [Chitinophaga polysaccharea]|jgi:hypothetical protein|uniref:Uncharacterized protein n=1 Tax=Chitinophaga polysaccharea TaxID=1293035 RepID=A0A561P0U0_9BACT|nr:hypothetical protein [Chitinophaga polysaccharea]TWF31746.1 hypothetical protein FHW36_11840 [Chitinophaga polysaccharea]
MILLDAKQIITQIADNYIGPTVGICMVMGVAYAILHNWDRYKDDFKAAIVGLSLYALYGLLGAAVIVAVVEAYRNLKLY